MKCAECETRTDELFLLFGKGVALFCAKCCDALQQEFRAVKNV